MVDGFLYKFDSLTVCGQLVGITQSVFKNLINLYETIFKKGWTSLKGLAHQLVLVMVVKKTKVAWYTNNRKFYFLLVKYHYTRVFQQ